MPSRPRLLISTLQYGDGVTSWKKNTKGKIDGIQQLGKYQYSLKTQSDLHTTTPRLQGRGRGHPTPQSLVLALLLIPRPFSLLIELCSWPLFPESSVSIIRHPPPPARRFFFPPNYTLTLLFELSYHRTPSAQYSSTYTTSFCHR